jgi:hypothetical protein
MYPTNFINEVTILFGKCWWSLIIMIPLRLQVFINVYGGRYVLPGLEMVQIRQIFGESPLGCLQT